MPRVLLITPTHGSRFGSPRAERSARLAAAFSQGEWKVEFVLADRAGDEGDYRAAIAESITFSARGPSDSAPSVRPAARRRARLRRRLIRILRPLVPFPDAYAGWGLSAWWSLRRGQPPDVVYAFAWPFSAIVLGAALARRYRVPLVVDIGDPWPHRGWGDRMLERFSMRCASLIVVPTAGMAELYRKRPTLSTARIVVASNGADLLISRGSGRDRPQLLSLGTLSEARVDPIPAFRILAKLQREGALDFHVYGSLWIDLPADLLRHYRGVVPKDAAIALAAAADAIVVVGNPDPRRIPSKVNELARSNLPVLYLAGSRADPGALLLAETGHAVVAMADDPVACRRAAMELLTRVRFSARPRPDGRFSWDRATELIVRAVDEIAGEGKRSVR